MSNITCFLIAIAVVLVILTTSTESFTSRRNICNDYDGRCYPIVSGFEDTMSASKMLAYLNEFAIKIMRHMRQKYLWDKQGSVYHANMTKRLLKNYVSENIIENAPNSTVNTSYVEDKGKVFAVCLREKLSGKNRLHDKNILEFVVMHEMAHLASLSHGHDDVEFWINFKIIMENAVEMGIHTPVDYSETPVNYCKLDVNYSPYYDRDLL